MEEAIEKRIRKGIIDFKNSNNGLSPKYLLMSITGYNELIHDLAVKNEDMSLSLDEDIEGLTPEDAFYLNETNSYNDMEIYVSQNLSVKDFILSI